MTIQPRMSRPRAMLSATLMLCGALTVGGARAAEPTEDFDALVKRLQAEKPAFAERQKKLLHERYDLSDRPAAGVTMSRGKPVQDGVRVKLPQGRDLGTARGHDAGADQGNADCGPRVSFPLPHPHHEAGGMIFPKPLIDETKRQTLRDLDAVRSRLRPAAAPAAGVPGAYLSDDAAGPGRRLEGQAGDAGELLRAVQGHPESQAARRIAAAGDAVSAGAVQCHRRPPRAEGAPGRGVLRLPCQRPHERRHAHGRRHPPERASPSHRHAVAARLERPAAVRLAARAEDGRGLHRVRAARRVFRRRSRAGARERA